MDFIKLLLADDPTAVHMATMITAGCFGAASILKALAPLVWAIRRRR